MKHTERWLPPPPPPPTHTFLLYRTVRMYLHRTINRWHMVRPACGTSKPRCRRTAPPSRSSATHRACLGAFPPGRQRGVRHPLARTPAFVGRPAFSAEWVGARVAQPVQAEEKKKKSGNIGKVHEANLAFLRPRPKGIELYSINNILRNAHAFKFAPRYHTT